MNPAGTLTPVSFGLGGSDKHFFLHWKGLDLVYFMSKFANVSTFGIRLRNLE
jgi:hypothetical protein